MHQGRITHLDYEPKEEEDLEPEEKEKIMELLCAMMLVKHGANPFIQATLCTLSPASAMLLGIENRYCVVTK